MNKIKDKIAATFGPYKPDKPELIVEEEIVELPPKYIVHLNTPSGEYVTSKNVVVSGWILIRAGEPAITQVRIKNNETIIKAKFGIERHDVARAYPDLEPGPTLRSGFKTKDFIYQEGMIEIQAYNGGEWETARSSEVKYSPENLVPMLITDNLSEKMAEHQNLLENKSKYYHETASGNHYEPHQDDARLVAFYLPQFHPIPENDEVWGKGFTEWTNVAAGRSRFVGHYQPILPADLGFYDLRIDQNIADQILLAKQHGIHGFCFYYYWFSGRRLLEKPLDRFLEHKEWDFNFMIAWANENWTKRWDGLDQEVIVAQQYLEEDPLTFIKDVEHILLDSRYIRHEDKPVLIVYRGSRLKEPERYIKVWRKYFKETHNQDLHILSVLGLDVDDPTKMGFDAGIEFEPLTVAKRTDFNIKKPNHLNANLQLLDKHFQGGIADYRQIALDSAEHNEFNFPTYKSLVPSWDNDARKKGNGPTIFQGANPDIYQKWLTSILEVEIKKTKAPLIFINAWNEWAEGTVLEPTKAFGHALLNRTSQALAQYSNNADNKLLFPLYGLVRPEGTDLAVIVHIYYEEEWRIIAKKLKLLDQLKHSLFITINEKNRDLIADIEQQHPHANILVVPNRGRDVLPFLYAAIRVQDLGYKYILKLHTKRSLHRNDGAVWFKDMIDSLLPSAAKTKRIYNALAKDTAFIGPAGHHISLQRYIGSNEAHLKILLSEVYSDELSSEVLANLGDYPMFGGSMFWCRVDAITPLLLTMPIPEDFESEKGQIDGTFAHAVERLISIMPVIENKKIAISSSNGLTAVNDDYKHYEYPFAS